MSDDESFVILGSSPMSSLENDYGMEATNVSIASSLESDTPGSRFTSLKSSQISNLGNALEVVKQTPDHEKITDSTMKMSANSQKMADSLKNINTQESEEKEQEIAASKLWSRPPQVQVEENIIQLSLEDCAVKSPIKQQQNLNESVQTSTSINHEESSDKTTPPLSADRNLASNFIMGEVNSDVLKTSVYSQFPSISMEACAEDVLKLQNMVTEYSELKTTIKKANNTMKLFYNNSLQWKDKMKTIEEDYKQQLNACQKEIEELRKQNKEIESNFKMQIEALEIARKKDLEENVQEISEKNALLENMRAQILKLEQQQLSSFEFVFQNQDNQQKNQLNKVYVTHEEYEVKIKDLQRQLSGMLASNLDLKDVEKQYVDELNCLKVNLTAAEELIGKNRAEIAQLTALNIEKQQQVQTLDNALKSLQDAFEEQKERIVLLEAQSELHRNDFEIEKQSREAIVKEKQQILQDLRSLQKRNRELIEEHQNMAEAFQNRLSAAAANDGTQIAAASAAAQTYFNNPQRPIRALPSLEACATPPRIAMHMCPICNKAFKQLHILLSHVNDCVDKN